VVKKGDIIMGEKLTNRQSKILDFIRKHIEMQGFPPTFREIGEEFGIRSTNGVRASLVALEKKGYLTRQSRLSRGIELTEKTLRTLTSRIREIPIVGRVAAGQPILAEENLEGTISLDSEYIKADNIFALRVRGDSMRDAGIFDGDSVFARQQTTADRGDIIIAIIGDEATVKKYYPERDRVRLEPANDSYGPIIVERDTPGFRIAGKVVGLLRKM